MFGLHSVVWRRAMTISEWVAKMKIVTLHKKTQIYVFSRKAGGSGPAPLWNCQLHSASWEYIYTTSSPASGPLHTFLSPWQPIKNRTPGPKPSELPSLRLDILTQRLFSEFNEGGVLVHPPAATCLLKPCMYSKLSDRTGLWIKRAPWEGSTQKRVLRESWPTPIEIFWDLPSELLLLDQPQQVNGNFRVALLCFMVTRKPGMSRILVCLRAQSRHLRRLLPEVSWISRHKVKLSLCFWKMEGLSSTTVKPVLFGCCQDHSDTQLLCWVLRGRWCLLLEPVCHI